jgi:hypothetical protein
MTTCLEESVLSPFPFVIAPLARRFPTVTVGAPDLTFVYLLLDKPSAAVTVDQNRDCQLALSFGLDVVKVQHHYVCFPTINAGMVFKVLKDILPLHISKPSHRPICSLWIVFSRYPMTLPAIRLKTIRLTVMSVELAFTLIQFALTTDFQKGRN